MNEITQIKAKKISQLPKPSDYILKNGFDDLWMLLGYFSEDGSKNIIPTNYRINLSRLYEAIYNDLDGRFTDRINELVERINNKLRNEYVTKDDFEDCCDGVRGKLAELERALEELEEKVDNYHANVFEISYTGLSNVSAFGPDGVSPRPNGVKEGSSATITIKPQNIQGSDRSGYHLPENINVHGADYTWTLNDDGTATLFLSNPTSAISLEIPGEPNIYDFSVSENDHIHLAVEDLPDNISFEDSIPLVYLVDNGYDLLRDNIIIENGNISNYRNFGDKVELSVSPNGLGDQVNVQVISTLHNYGIIPHAEGDDLHTQASGWPPVMTIENDVNNPITLTFISDEGFKANITDVSGASIVENSYVHDPETGITTIQIYDPIGQVKVTYTSTSLMEVYFGILHDQSLFTYEIPEDNDESEWMPTGFAVPIENTGLPQYNECPIADDVTLDFGSYPNFYADSVLVVPVKFFRIEDNPFDTYYTDGTSTYRLYNQIGELNVPRPEFICSLGEHNGEQYYGIRYYNISGSFTLQNRQNQQAH